MPFKSTNLWFILKIICYAQIMFIWTIPWNVLFIALCGNQTLKHRPIQYNIQHIWHHTWQQNIPFKPHRSHADSEEWWLWTSQTRLFVIAQNQTQTHSNTSQRTQFASIRSSSFRGWWEGWEGQWANREMTLFSDLRDIHRFSDDKPHRELEKDADLLPRDCKVFDEISLYPYYRYFCVWLLLGLYFLIRFCGSTRLEQLTY